MLFNIGRGQGDGEGGAASLLALDADGAAVLQDNLTAEAG